MLKTCIILLTIYLGLLTPVYCASQYFIHNVNKKIKTMPSYIDTIKPMPTATVMPQPAPPPIEYKSKITSPPKLDSSNEIYTITAYDLSVASCGKTVTSRGYAETRSGYNLANHTRKSAMTVAVDTRIFKLGTKIAISFVNKKYQFLNGVYTARDTGSAVKGHIIDLFMGDFCSEKESRIVRDFGSQKAFIKIIDE